MSKLKNPTITYDKQVKMWVIIDKETGIGTQARTKTELKEAFIEALRCMCLTYQDIYKKNRRAKRREG